MGTEKIKNQEGKGKKKIPEKKETEKPSYKSRIMKRMKGSEISEKTKVEEASLPKDEIDELIRKLDDESIDEYKDRVPQNLEDIIKVMQRLQEQERNTTKEVKGKESFENTEMAKRAISLIDLLLTNKNSMYKGVAGELDQEQQKVAQMVSYGPEGIGRILRDTIKYDLLVLDQYMGGEIKNLISSLEKASEKADHYENHGKRSFYTKFDSKQEYLFLLRIRDSISTYQERQDNKKKVFQELKELSDPIEQNKKFKQLTGQDVYLEKNIYGEIKSIDYVKEEIIRNLNKEYIADMIKIAGDLKKSAEEKIEVIKGLEISRDIKIGAVNGKTDIESFKPIIVEGLSEIDAIEAGFMEKEGFTAELEEYKKYVEEFADKETAAINERILKLSYINSMEANGKVFAYEVGKILDNTNIDSLRKMAIVEEIIQKRNLQKEELKKKLDLEDLIIITEGQTEIDALNEALNKYMDKKFEKLSRDKNYVLNVNKSYSDAKEYYKRIEEFANSGKAT